MTIKINDIALHYEALGQGNPLILIGGLTANCREWLQMEQALAKTFTVYKPDNRGAGETTGSCDAFTIEQMADDIAAFLQALNIPSAYMVGHSMGGAILQRVCMRHPSRVKAAIIASSFAAFPYAAQLYIENTATLIKAGLPLQTVLDIISTRLYGSSFLMNHEKMALEYKRLLTDKAPQSPENYWAQVMAIKHFDASHDLGNIKCPTLILNGEMDVLTPTYLSEALCQGIKKAQLTLIPDCGHMIPQEKPEAFVDIILDFFNGR